MTRAMERGVFKPEELQTITVGYNLEFDIPYPVDNDCQEELGYRFQSALGRIMGRRRLVFRGDHRGGYFEPGCVRRQYAAGSFMNQKG